MQDTFTDPRKGDQIAMSIRTAVSCFIVFLFICATGAATLFFAGKDFIAPAGQSYGELVLRNVSVVDVSNGAIVADQSLYIKDGEIVRMGPADGFPVTQGVPEKDLDGQFVMPGLWDMHTHLATRGFEHTGIPANFIAGVFYVREMNAHCVGAGCVGSKTKPEFQKLADAISDGRLLGPRVMSMGTHALVSPRMFSDPIPGTTDKPMYVIRDKGDVSKLLSFAKREGFDFLKTYNSFPRDLYFDLAEKSVLQGLSIQGHIPRSISLSEAIDAGQRTVEHARYPILGCSKMTDAFQRAYTDYNEGKSEEKVSLSGWYERLLEEEDTAVCDALLEKWGKSGTYYVPTHITRKAEFMAPERPWLTDRRADYVPHVLISGAWEDEALGYTEKFSANPGQRKIYQRFYEAGLKLTGRAHKAGVKIMAGTDVGDLAVYPGFSLHEELENLVYAGLSPLEALQAATIVPARFYGLQASHGSVGVGKVAELIILDGNPLEDIKNTLSIRALFHQGALYDRATIDRISSEVKYRASGVGLALYSGWELLMAKLLFSES